jgi:inorganic pyrophosphatase
MGEQLEPGKKAVRNDRLLAVERATHEYAKIADLKDLDKKLLEELEKFFVNYHQLQGKKYKVLDRCGAKDALKLLKKTMK